MENVVCGFDSNVLPLVLNSKFQASNFKQIPITNVPICNLAHGGGGDKLHPNTIFLKECLKINTFWFSGGRIFSLLIFLFDLIFNLLRSKKNLLIHVCFYKKELEILKRQNQKKRLKFHHIDRIIFSILNRILFLSGDI